jgi:hypothetical protein
LRERPLADARAINSRVGILHSSTAGAGVDRKPGFDEYFRIGPFVSTGAPHADLRAYDPDPAAEPFEQGEERSVRPHRTAPFGVRFAN